MEITWEQLSDALLVVAALVAVWQLFRPARRERDDRDPDAPIEPR